MSSLSDLLLRVTVASGYQTKGSTLSFAELDANLILLANVIHENIVAITPGGVTPYDPAVEYSSGQYVTYGGNLWLYVGVSPSTGNTPATPSIYWAIQSTGALSHQQNTDSYTNKNSFGVGDGTDTDKIIFARNGDTNTPRLRYNHTTNKWQFSNDGTTYADFGSGSGSAASAVLFTFDSDIFTEQAIMFFGLIGTLSVHISDAINTVSYSVGVDGNPTTYTTYTTLSNVQTWITANATGVAWWLKISVAYKSGRFEPSQINFLYV